MKNQIFFLRRELRGNNIIQLAKDKGCPISDDYIYEKYHFSDGVMVTWKRKDE